MARRTLHVNLSPEAAGCLDAPSRERNRAGRTLRDWLVRSFLASRAGNSSQTSFFGTTIEVDDDVPLLLEALGRATKQSPDELVEAWALEAPRGGAAPETIPASVQLPGETRGKVAELLDLGETLFEETVADAQRKVNPYPEGEKAARTGADVFRGLRTLLGLESLDVGERHKGDRPS